MGSACCGGESTKKNKRSAALADLTVKDAEDITFLRQVRRCTYGPEDKEPVDVTNAVRDLIKSGKKEISGGILTAIGADPFPDEPKVLKVWYVNEKADQEWDDFDQIKLTGPVLLALYGVEISDSKDVTAIIEKMQGEGNNEFVGGPHVLLNEPLPCDPNKLRVWYA